MLDADEEECIKEHMFDDQATDQVAMAEKGGMIDETTAKVAAEPCCVQVRG